MDRGRIIERGTHHELLAAGAHYAQMWALQQEADEEVDGSSAEPLRSAA